MLLTRAATPPLSFFSREIRLLYWISPLLTAPLTASATRPFTILDTRVTARFPRIERRWPIPTIVRTIRTQANKKQKIFAFCLADIGGRRRMDHHLITIL